MKKTSMPYVLAWYGISVLLIVSMFTVIILAGEEFLEVLSILDVLLLIAIPIAVPVMMKKRMERCAAMLEREFANVNYKFTSHNCVIFLDTEGGHIGVVWKNNPSRLQMVDPAKITNIRTNNGQQLRGTALVSCQFFLDGKKVKIYTLRVSGGQLAMKDPRVLEAISKADQMGEMLRAVQTQNGSTVA